MDRHETQARIDAQIAEWKNNLDSLKAKVGASTGDADVARAKAVARLQSQLDEFKINAAKARDTADDKWDAAAKDLETTWAEWEARAKQAWSDVSK